MCGFAFTKVAKKRDNVFMPNSKRFSKECFASVLDRHTSELITVNLQACRSSFTSKTQAMARIHIGLLHQLEMRKTHLNK